MPRETQKQALYRRLAMLLARLPRGYQTIGRIVRQRSGSPDDIKLAELALAEAYREVYLTELKPLRALKRETNRRKRAQDRARMMRAIDAWKRRTDYPRAMGLYEEWQKLEEEFRDETRGER